ncbi:MAG: adenosylcobalamin-dependent ribonucleoside-diphosphate reductase [Anaerolineae bacterium]|nr:adenosylcobalamin-dependent ribonucleoside-diphosphate reductase [Anaerolineae bacterium]
MDQRVKTSGHALPARADERVRPALNLSPNARVVLEKRYLRRGLDGKPIETPEEMFDRVARVVAEPDARYGSDPSVTRDKFYDLLTTLRFFPNSPTFTGAGTPLGQLAACFTPEMRVTTEAGVKPIAELEVGDRVLTHLGRYRPVLECSRRNYEGEILRIKVKLIGTTLRVTPEHPILTPRGWVPAGELQVGDLVALGVPQGVSAAPRFDLAEMAYADELELQVAEASVRARRPSEYQNSGRQAEWVNRFIELTPDLARLCGYYISEGTVDPEERYVRFTFGADEVTYQQDVIDLVERIFGVSARPVKSRQGSWTTLNVYSRVVAAWFRAHLGHHSYGKRVPVWLQFAAPELQEEFLIGVMRGDGMFNQKVYLTSGRKTPKVFRALRLTLGNPGLVQQIWQMALRLGYDAAIRPVDTSYVTDAARETAQISMPPLQSRALVQRAFGVDLPAPDERYVRNTVRRTGENIYFEIESIEGEDYTGLVYNCEVAEDHSYVVEGVAVHNCFVLPIADDMGRDPRGIFSTLRAAALIQQTGGGNGFSFSRLRPRGDRVSTSAGVATGPVGFLRVYDTAFGEVAQGGCLLPETLVFTADGLLRLDEIADAQQLGWQPHNLQVATDEGWHASPRAFNNGVAPVLRVHTRQGLSLAGTPEHRVKVMTREGLAWRALQDLRAGDWILVQLGQHRGRLRALAQPKREHGNQMFPRLPSILDEELAFFIGYLIGDGFVATQEGDHRVGVSVPHSSYLMVEMPALMERLFGVSVHRQQKPADRSVTLVMDNRAVKEFLQKNGLSKSRSHLAQVPRLIRQSPPEIVGAFLRGLFEADGSISHGYPCLTTTSPRLAEEVATLLIGLGCPVKIRSVMPGVSHFGEKVVYHVRIESSVGLQAWRERIGCDPRSRFAACMAWESDLRRESTYVLPNARYWLEPVLEAITLEQVDARGRGRGIKFRSAVPRLRRALLRYLRGERQFTRSAYDELCKQFPEFAEHARSPKDKWFVQVLGVERIGESLTLDLEVEDNHTYLAYGMVTHNTRRGANMAVLRVDHPDIFDFVRCKEKEGAISNFNISVGITDAFMRAVEEDTDFDLVNPRDGKVWRTIRARELFNDIVKHAHHNGEPGVLFLDTANRSNPVPHLYELEATNPCGEQWLGPYENCCLGSINLAQHITPDDRMDWAKLRDTVELSVHFLDNVVDANKYVPAIPELAEAAHRARRIGLGIMGLGDVMYRLGIRYGSRAGEDFAGQVMEFVRYHAMKTSIELAKTRGAFPAIKGSIYDPENLKWTPPKPLEPFTYDWGRPKLDWGEIVIGIKKYGIRNAAQTTIAPTGTIATVAGVESYGCEPVFALAYTRHVNDNGKDLQLEYVSPLFERALIQAGVDEATRKKIFERVRVTGTCQDVDLVPEKIRDTFVVASDITPEEHVRMQAALQAFVDNSISKTINFPETATVEDVERAYFLAWKLGCKGITVYRAGSREQVVLETKATAEKKSAVGDSVSAKKPRPRAVHGSTYEIATPLGKAYVTVNRNGEGEPFEVFCNVGKAGSDTSAVSEAIGRLISLALRLPSPMSPTERLKEIVDQLSGIGGGRSLGFGARRVRSLPDGIAQALAEDLGQVRVEPSESKQIPLFKIGDLCPECGQASFVNEEGCRKCYACGYSEC